ncbi:hypothetical protein [Helicovermis profundi]|uniref:Type II secretion system protein GspF domain-containing protein n=1 Tax=Helicovermis profundi TaxID=3065157 RepID=A0AAU9E4S9_9FIRM|nr:hypothetical protein HLPR_19500 [Clostridia bacterium S502]
MKKFLRNFTDKYLNKSSINLLKKDLYSIVIISLLLSIIYATMFFKNAFSIIIFIIFYILFFLTLKGIILKKYKKKELELLKDFIYSLLSSLASGLNIENSFCEYFKGISEKDKLIHLNIFRSIDRIIDSLKKGNSIIYALKQYEIENVNLDNVIKTIKCNIETGNDISKTLYNQFEFICKIDEIEDEIWASYSDKRLEASIMILIPPILVNLLEYYDNNYFSSIFLATSGYMFILIIYLIFLLGIFILKGILTEDE